jgi:hypothetical protein
MLWVLIGFLVVSFIFSWIRIGKPTLMHTTMLRTAAVLVMAVFCLSYFFDTTVLVAGVLVFYCFAFAEEMLLWGFFGDVDRDTKSFYAVYMARKRAGKGK